MHPPTTICRMVSFALIVIEVASMSLNLKDSACVPLPQPVLSDILGSAFNSRYMSVNEPVEDEDLEALDLSNPKRSLLKHSDFYVDEGFAQEISDEPAWQTNHASKRDVSPRPREKRSAVKSSRQWECESKIRWHDLGPDYFPRFLRSVECTSKTCWYDMMKCKPRSFTVKLLRRKRGKCVSDNRTKFGSLGLPNELLELWVWEERAVNFCCDCSF